MKLDAPRILDRPDHRISRRDIDPNTLKVLYRLHNAGRTAYLVGGAVRDLLLDREPKDFDVGTDAGPSEVRRLFRNSRIIGRRFRLVHVLYPEGVVEVSTFRKTPDPEQQNGDPEDRLITSDNTFGTPREDAFRRDFTINALFYDIGDFSVIDYCGGIDDLEAKLVRAIGNPDLRFQEDPVRMVRACEFAARLGFSIEPETALAIERNRNEIEKASPARLTEEVVSLLRSGHAADAFQVMLEFGLLESILPEAFAMVTAEARGLGRFNRIPLVLDDLANEGRAVPDSVLLAAVLLPGVLLRRYDVEGVGGRPLSRPDLERLVREVETPFLTRLKISALRSQEIHGSLTSFFRLCEPQWTPGGRARYAATRHFDLALFLFEALVRATGEGDEVLDLWREAGRERPEPTVEGPEEEGSPGRPRRRRRRRRRPAGE